MIYSRHDEARGLVYQIVVNLLRQNKSVLVLNSRSSIQDSMARLIAHIANIDTYKISSGRFDISDWSGLTSAIEMIENLPLSIHDGLMTTDAILAKIQGQEMPFSLIVVDDIEEISHDRNKTFLEGLYAYAKKSQSAILIISKLGGDICHSCPVRSIVDDKFIRLIIKVRHLSNSNKQSNIRIIKNNFITINESVNLSLLSNQMIYSSIGYEQMFGYECNPRKVVINCETTGISASNGHRIIEIAAIELMGNALTGRQYHQYINPEIKMTNEVIGIHGISNEFLADKPVFSDILDEFMSFIKGAELIIHHAKFDMDHINAELKRDGRYGNVEKHFKITDTMAMAKHRYPNERMALDSLCHLLDIKHFDNDQRDGLSDCEDVAHLYLRLLDE